MDSMKENSSIFVHVDKVVVRITGVKVKGLNTVRLENLLQDKLQTMVRVIGVTGESLEMDVYGLDENTILRDENGWIRMIALEDGITVTDLAQMEHVKKIREVPIDQIPDTPPSGCSAERWLPVHE